VGWHSSRPVFSGVWRSQSGRGILIALSGYLAVCSISVFISTHPLHSLIGLVGKTFEYALFFLMAGDIANDPALVEKGGKTLLWAAAWVGIYAVFQEGWIGHWNAFPQHGVPMDPIIPRALVYGKMVGPYNNPNDLATFAMMALLMAIAHLAEKPRVPQMGRWLLGLLLIGCLVRASSRGALLGFSAGLLFLLFFSPRQKWVRIGSVAILVIVSVLILIGKASIKEALLFADRASMERRDMWNIAWSMIQAKPLLGQGLNTFMANYLTYAVKPAQGPSYAHNCFLQIAAETGFLGLSCFLWFLVALFLSFWRSLKASFRSPASAVRPWLIGFTAALMSFLIQSAFDTTLYSLRQATLFWTLAGLTFGAGQAALRR